jgi:hypothetical protein
MTIESTFLKINDNAYRLELPSQYGRLNDSFHVSLLESYVRRAGEELPDPISIDEDNRFLMDRLLDERISKKKIKYLIK